MATSLATCTLINVDLGFEGGICSDYASPVSREWVIEQYSTVFNANGVAADIALVHRKVEVPSLFPNLFNSRKDTGTG